VGVSYPPDLPARSREINKERAITTPTLCKKDRAGVWSRALHVLVRKTTDQDNRAIIIAQNIRLMAATTATAIATNTVANTMQTFFIFLTSSQKVSSKLKGDFRPKTKL